ncbi:hypothetical protein HWB81_gp12 [Bacillus phage Wes44]|uniref:Uncharacterized protein n=1 Tax=Bacillus phage Wes44 TaxID=2283012 RepID=A0A346FK16_9CAUD|nr:hypothetical protein HWB81_gp12 [Bacillus phage Wes44]AXN58321.1 hypothetical protein Wes44_12 [Bacillus phage Wes44]
MNYILEITLINNEIIGVPVALTEDTMIAKHLFIESNIDVSSTLLMLEETEMNHAMFVPLDHIICYVWRKEGQ